METAEQATGQAAEQAAGQAAEEIIHRIVDELRAGREVDDRELVRITHTALRRAASIGAPADKRAVAKRRLLALARRVHDRDPARWAAWNVTPEVEDRLFATLRMKPRRTASGVATITVITKPWPCSGDCAFCPNDARMPKSYLHREPACERAEQNWFDPYLQVSARLTALSQMGHAVDKVELIVLGGTWSDYPEGYRAWFARELFRALNDGVGEAAQAEAARRRALYREAGFPEGEDGIRAFTAAAQREIDAGELAYNRAVRALYGEAPCWRRAASLQTATFAEVEREQRVNEGARHRAVGLVMETRPDAVTPASLMHLRRLGATKVQIGVQSLDQCILDMNSRGIEVPRIARAFELLRAFGFKVHAHAMANLLGSTPASDIADFRKLMDDPAFRPDEVKLYPCALIEGTRLAALHRQGAWRPYTEDELLDVLAADVRATPPWCRISRMIRDFSSGDILVGNKKPNLRQLVERRLREEGEDAASLAEIRFREVGTGEVDVAALRVDEVAYETSNTSERFLQWVAPDGRIAGFCRLSLPDRLWMAEHGGGLPVGAGEAMIREVHVYGAAARLGEQGRAAQHLGLGRRLVERACEIARGLGYARVHVISAVGTRDYYRGLGFADDGLYQTREL